MTDATAIVAATFSALNVGTDEYWAVFIHDGESGKAWKFKTMEECAAYFLALAKVAEAAREYQHLCIAWASAAGTPEEDWTWNAMMKAQKELFDLLTEQPTEAEGGEK